VKPLDAVSIEVNRTREGNASSRFTCRAGKSGSSAQKLAASMQAQLKVWRKRMRALIDVMSSFNWNACDNPNQAIGNPSANPDVEK
jgi:hypothetical protein